MGRGSCRGMRGALRAELSSTPRSSASRGSHRLRGRFRRRPCAEPRRRRGGGPAAEPERKLPRTRGPRKLKRRSRPRRERRPAPPAEPDVGPAGPRCDRLDLDGSADLARGDRDGWGEEPGARGNLRRRPSGGLEEGALTIGFPAELDLRRRGRGEGQARADGRGARRRRRRRAAPGSSCSTAGAEAAGRRAQRTSATRRWSRS